MSIKIIESGITFDQIEPGETFKTGSIHFLKSSVGQAVNLGTGRMKELDRELKIEKTDLLLVETGSLSDEYDLENKEEILEEFYRWEKPVEVNDVNNVNNAPDGKENKDNNEDLEKEQEAGKAKKTSEFDNEEDESEGEENVPKNKQKLSTEEELLLDFTGKACKLRRFPKTEEVNHDPDMAHWGTYYNVLGSKSNICDMVLSKIRKKKIDPRFKKELGIICRSCDEDCSQCTRRPADCFINAVAVKESDKK